MPGQFTVLKSASALAPLLAPVPAMADEAGRVEVGVRAGTSLASGVPANDMPGYGIHGMYALSDRWSVGLGIYYTEFDYEEPARRVGLPLDPDAEPIDAKAEQLIFSASGRAVLFTARCAPALVPGGETRRGRYRRAGCDRSHCDRRHFRNPYRGRPRDHRFDVRRRSAALRRAVVRRVHAQRRSALLSLGVGGSCFRRDWKKRRLLRLWTPPGDWLSVRVVGRKMAKGDAHLL